MSAEDSPAEQSPNNQSEGDSTPLDQEVYRLGVWRSGGTRGQDNPPAEILQEVEHTDGEKYYKLRDPNDHGHQWFAPVVEVDIVTPETGSKEEFDDWQKSKSADEAGGLATQETVETTEQVQSIVDETEEAKEQAKERAVASWGRFTQEGKYELTADPNELAAEIDIPAEVITLAAAKGFPPEYLLSARDNPYTAQRLRDAGIFWGKEFEPGLLGSDPTEENESGHPPPTKLSHRLTKTPEEVAKLEPDAQATYLEEHGASDLRAYKELYKTTRAQYAKELDAYFHLTNLDQSSDPMFYLEAKGSRKDLEVEDIADHIESTPGNLKESLKRPGKLPLGLHKIPIVGTRAARLKLARAMHRKELKERRSKGLGKNHEDGLLRLGIPRTRRNLAYIKRHDEDVRVIRNKLSSWNNHEYKGPEKASARRDLAELIHRTRERQDALTDQHIHHRDVYFHEPFSKAYGKFKDTKSTGSK